MDHFVYARISLDRRDGAGVDRQLEDARDLCRRRGWPIAREFVDNNRSAWRAGGARPEYAALITAIRESSRCRVIVYKTDRLHRQPRELEDLIKLADLGGVEIIAIQGGDLDLNTSDGRALARVLAAMNAKESDDKSERIIDQKRQARGRGQPHGGQRPFGWARLEVALPDGTSRWTWNPMRHDPDEAALLRDAVDDLLAGASLSDIARRWNAAGVAQPQTGRAAWTTDAVRQVVGNPRNAGLVGHRSRVRTERAYQLYSRPVVVGEARWPAIVERERWEQLQALLVDRGAHCQVPKRRSLLTGLLLCGACGTTMVRTADHAGPRAEGAWRKVWRCPTYQRKDAPRPPCGSVTIDADGVERLLTARALELAETVDLAAIAQQRDGGGREAAELSAQLAELDRRADEAAVSYAAGRLDLRTLERATAELDRARKTARERLGELAGGALLAPYLAAPGSLTEAWEERLTTDQKREVIRALVGQVRILPARRGYPRFDPDRVVPVRDPSART